VRLSAYTTAIYYLLWSIERTLQYRCLQRLFILPGRRPDSDDSLPERWSGRDPSQPSKQRISPPTYGITNMHRRCMLARTGFNGPGA
jgi:hypothetical protein